MSLQNESLNFELFTKLPSPPSSSLLTPFVAVSPLVRPLAAHTPRPGQNRLLRPGIAPNRSLLASRAAATRPVASPRDTPPNAVAALDVGAARVAAPLPTLLLKPSSPFHDANFDFPSSARHFPEPNPPLRRSERASSPAMVVAAPAPTEPLLCPYSAQISTPTTLSSSFRSLLARPPPSRLAIAPPGAPPPRHCGLNSELHAEPPP